MPDDANARSEAKTRFEAALQDYIIASYDEPGNMFVQDYVICIASESMDEGNSNITYHNYACRPGMAAYAVIGLLDAGQHYFRKE